MWRFFGSKLLQSASQRAHSDDHEQPCATCKQQPDRQLYSASDERI
ncbi:hypothetical protein SEA_EASTWEST_77 [Arthrobacter phage EastWest]|uniref:Uncharacterized protein n=1 Tax=Arthrobacter phage EastWest TaxID=2894292 RepID=A0AAE8YLP6_9CAUD|nr:hypothetical protein SEA_EASTWEST_77 [Arthrobacter phage EastWest]